jgi:hypothetical protein
MKSQWADTARKVLGISLVLGLLSSVSASAQPGVATSNEPAAVPASPPETTKPPEAQSRAAWAKAMTQTPQPKNGCFKSSYPSTEWQEVPCTAAPSYPQPPRRGSAIVDDRHEVSVKVPTGFISTATGSFDSVTGVTSESGPIANTGPSVAKAYTLQLNTNFFISTAAPVLRTRCAQVGSSSYSKTTVLRAAPTFSTGWSGSIQLAQRGLRSSRILDRLRSIAIRTIPWGPWPFPSNRLPT